MMSVLASVLQRLERDGDCLIWTGGKTVGGYGAVYTPERKVYAHRFVWEQCYGPIPDGLVIDHLCRNRLCVNPKHLEPVGNRENILRGISPSARQARQTHCKYGHPLSGDNLRVHVKGKKMQRICIECSRRRGRESMRQFRADKNITLSGV